MKIKKERKKERKRKRYVYKCNPGHPHFGTGIRGWASHKASRVTSLGQLGTEGKADFALRSTFILDGSAVAAFFAVGDLLGLLLEIETGIANVV